ncbi:MAG: hypothetical protein IIB21_06740 [Chloroflexi bacterium]|nr:hypothetical protein [Chloroflexota bacterium]
MARVEYAKGQGFRLTGKAQVLGQEIERLRRRRGHLTAQLVVDAASDPASRLHGEFEWDDTAAAAAYRLEQAGYLIRAIVIVREPQNGDPRIVRAFVYLQDDEAGPIYTSISVAMGDPAMREQVLRRAWQELEGWRRRYSEYDELAKVFSAIDEVAKAV